MTNTASSRYLKIGHRGNPGQPRHGENTIPSFKEAFGLGADAIECDVRRAKDGALIVLHDAALDRTTEKKGLAKTFTSEELQSVKTDNGERIPLFSELLDTLAGEPRCKLIVVELKEEGLIEEVKEVIHRRQLERRVIITAFDEDDRKPDSTSTWNELKLAHPEIETGFIVSAAKIQRMGWEALVKTAKTQDVRWLSVNFTPLTSTYIRQAHAEGLKVLAWTVNDPANIKKVAAMRVDAIASDIPALLT